MENDEEFPIPKEKWGTGPWQDEPDRLEFEHLGFPCLIRRNMTHGNFCGYVAVPPGHPWHGKVEDIDADAHGGINFTSACEGDICHVPKPGEPDNVWWLGFDCGHIGRDRLPGMEALEAHAFKDRPELQTVMRPHFPWLPQPTYKTISYVRAQCEALAEQAKAALLPPDLDEDPLLTAAGDPGAG